jgi:peroxiredoxin
MNTYLYPILADSEENAKKFESKYARKYPIFYDPSKKIPEMLNQEVKLLKFGRMPGLLILDKAGIIRYAYYGDSMSDIPENETLFEILEKI